LQDNGCQMVVRNCMFEIVQDGLLETSPNQERRRPYVIYSWEVCAGSHHAALTSGLGVSCRNQPCTLETLFWNDLEKAAKVGVDVVV
jgi:hypothetical protein